MLIHKLKMRTKLVLILLLPLLGLLYFSIFNIYDKIQVLDEMTQIENLTTLSVQVSLLIHETQKERGRTAGFLGAEGAEFKKELTGQRIDTDRQITNLTNFLEIFEKELLGDVFNTLLNDALTRLNNIENIRDNVSDLKISLNEAISYYTDMNTVFLDIIGQSSNLSNNSQLTIRLSSYHNFLQSKERAGIERAVLSNTFVADKFNPGMYEKFLYLIAEQDTYIDIFIKSAIDIDKEFFLDQMKHNSVIEVSNLRDIAIENKLKGGFGVDAGLWFDTITLKINQLKSIDDYLANGLINQVKKFISNAKSTLIVYVFITLIILVLSVLLSIVLITTIMKQLGGEPTEVVAIAKQISLGIFTTDINLKKDDHKSILYAMNKIATNLSDTISQIIDVSQDVSIGADQIALSAQQLSGNTIELSTNGEIVSSNVVEMEATISQNTNNASEGEKIAKVAAEDAKKGGDAVIETVNSMKRISERILVITEIANNINLLSLNASIEAARAGEYGKGFAVVASEVSKLAEKTLKASKEISELSISNVKISTNAGNLISNVVPLISKTFEVVQEISSASSEQNESMQHLSKSTIKFENISHSLSASSEELASTAEELSAQSVMLVELVKKFKIR